MKIWLNGSILPAAAACVDPSDRGFTLGDGVFETIRVVNRRPQYLPQHLRRLRDGLAVLAIPLTLSDADLARAITLALKANELESAAIRLTVSRGPASRGVIPPPAPDPTVLITSGPPPDITSPADAVLCTITRRNEMSPLSRIKSLNYLDSILARQEAVRRGADEALLLNTRGYLAEATTANILVFRDDMLVTPPLADGALPGIIREIMIERCGATEVPLLVEDLLAADAVFLINSLALRPLASIDGRPLRMRLDCLDDFVPRVMEGG